MTRLIPRILMGVVVCAVPCFRTAKAREPDVTPLADVPASLTKAGEVRVRGVVTAEIIRGYLFIQDDSGSLCLRLQDSKPFARGDRIEAKVVQYDGREFWYIADTAALVEKATLPDPLELSGPEFSVERHHSRYVSSRGVVVGHRRTTYSHIVEGRYVPLTYGVLETDCDGLPVRVCFDLESGLFETFPIGSHLRFTGSARVHDIRDRLPNPYVAIWLDDPAMAIVERLPSFFQRVEVRRLLKTTAIALAGGVLLIGMGWIMHRRNLRQLRIRNEELESRVAERTAELRDALERERKLGLVKSDFVSLVSHEFRTPLGVIMSAAEVLRRYFDRLEPAKRERHLDMICGSTGKLAEMIEEVLLLGRMEEGKVSYSANPIDLEKLCREIITDTRASLRDPAPVELECGDDLGGAVGDESLLRHIFGNLLSNACKYSPGDRKVRFQVKREGSNACLVVEDQGIGIPEADQGRLFASFTRGSNVGMLPGTGLGLVIVKRCVELHGGWLTLESAAGEGTVASVWLPIFPRAEVTGFRSKPPIPVES